MSDSDNDDGPGLQGILWGNLGEGDRLELDYMPQDVVGALGAVTNKTDLVAALRREVDDGPGGAGSSAAAGSPDSAAGGRGAVQYMDEPTLSEDLEDDEFPVLRPAAAPAAAKPMQLAAAAYGQRVAGEDDYDDEEEGPAAAAAQPMPAQQLQQHQQQMAPLQMPGAAALQQHYASLQQLQPGSQPYSLQMQQLQQLAGAPTQAAAASVPAAPEQPQQQPLVRRPQLTPEQERLRALNQANPAQEAQQEVLSFRYLDLDQLGEDIVHFSELYVPTDNQVKHAYLTSFARVPPSDKHQHDQPWERARQRADAMLNRHYQAKALQQPGAEADVVDDETDKFHRGDIAVAAAEGNVVQLGLANMKLEVVEELSDAEEELFASDPQGLGRAMLQAARLNAARAAAKAAVAAAKAAQAKAAATAGDADAAAEAAAEAADNAAASASLQGLTSGMEGLGLKGLAVNPHAVDALQADILPDWEHEVVWGSAAAGPAAGPMPSSLAGAGAGAALSTLQLQAVSQVMQSQQQQQQQQQHMALGSMLPPGSSMQPPLGLPGMSSALPGLPPAGTSTGLPPAHTGLPGAFPAALPGSSSALPGGSLGAGPLLGHGTAAQDPLGGFSTMGSQQAGDAAALAATSIPPDAAALAAAPMAADAAAAGEGAGEQGKGGKGKRSKGPRMGKQKKPLEAALADLKLHRHMLRLMPSIAAAAAKQAAAEAAEAAAAAAAAAAASSDRAAAAALPHLWGGSAAAAAADAASAAAAEAEDQLKLRHVGDLLQLDMKPVLPDDDDWLNDIVWDAQEAAAAAAAGAAASGALRQQQLARSVSSLASGFEHVGLGEQQQALVVRQPGGGGAAGRAAVLWDLNDPYMVFEAHSTQPYANASAMMHPVPAQAAAAVPPHLQNEKDPLLRQLAPLHISRDYLYQASERTSGRAMTTGRHSSLAINLTTVPLFPKDAFTQWWHRPRTWWSAAHLLYCMEEARRGRDVAWGRDPDVAPDNAQYTYEPVGLNLRKGKTGATEGGGSNFEGIWSFIANQKAYKDAFALEPPRMKSFGPEYNFAADDDRWMGSWLTKPDETTKSKSVAELGFRRGINWIIPVWTKVVPLRTREVAVLLPPNVPCRPPAALKTIKSLSAVTAGHMLLLEYLEERPLMMLQTGMGMRLTTYYRRKNDSDMHYQALQAEYSEGLLARQALPLTSADRLEARPPWMVGTPQLLTPDDPSPFYELAPIPNGEMQFAVDTPCFRAPAVPHVAAATDFLLARLPAGNIVLRELTGCVAVGQQHPSVTIWQPGSEQAVAYERARFKVWVIRTLRHRADLPNVKAGKAIPMVSLQEMQAQNAFINMSFGSDVNEVARMLREECQCMPVADKPGHWTFVPNAKLPSDQDLKKMVTPDMAVQYEALIAGIGQRQLYSLAEIGLAIQRQLADIGAGPVTTLRLVLDMLFPDAAGRQAAAAIEQCVLNTPWAQSQAYQAALVQDGGRNPAALTLVGRGDPTGRGRGFSFIREDPKRAKEEAAPPPGVTAQADGTITGTGADLRRLSNKRAGEILETKFGMDPSVVQSIARWDRIDMIRTNVRDPANAALVNSDPELQQWVRNVKMTAEDVKSKMRNTAAPLFAAQMNALHEPWDDGAASDDMSWGPPQQLAAAAAADAEADSASSRAKEVYDEAVARAQLAQDQAAMQAAQQALDMQPQPPGGLCRGNAKAITLPPNHRNPPAASRGRGQEALEGQRRIRRQITYFTANGSTVYRTVYIYSREEMAALNALYKSGDNFGQRKVATTERKFVYRRTVKLGETFIPAYPNCVPELPAPPFTEQEAAAAAAAGGAASAAGTAYWGTGAEGVAAAAAGYGTYVPQQEAVAWQQPVAAPAQPRAPKLSKKQRQQQALAAKKAAQAAAKKNKKRRRDDDFASDDESFEMSDSDDDAELAMAAEGSDDDDGSPRAKRARPARAAAAAAAASGGGGEAAVAAAPAAAAGLPALPQYVPPPDTTQGAADVGDLGEPLKIALREFNFCLKPACDTMIKFQASKQKMGFLKDAFYRAVPPNLLPDYAQVVPPERQMWLERIKQRLERQYYSSRAQFEADCMMIVQAAKAYHVLGGRGGKHPNPNVAIAAGNVVNEGLKWLQGQDAAFQTDYWEARVQIEKARAQGPEAFKQYFQAALASAQVAYAQGQELSGWHWLECEACKQWRLVTDYCFYTKQFDQPNQPFRCSENTDWPAPSCTDAAHWVE